MKKDNSLVSQTCPEINNASSTIDSIESNLSEQIVELRALDKGLEKLRTENSDLRTWGNEQYDRAEELEKELTVANKEIEELKQGLRELGKDYNELEKLQKEYRNW